jgi:hypothetical protein
VQLAIAPKPCIVLSMSPNSLFHPFHHQNAPFFFLKIENHFNIELKKKGAEIEKNEFLQQNV